MKCPRCQAIEPNKSGEDNDKHVCTECNYTDKLMHFKPKFRESAIHLMDKNLATLRENLSAQALDLAEHTDMIVDDYKINHVWENIVNKCKLGDAVPVFRYHDGYKRML